MLMQKLGTCSWQDPRLYAAGIPESESHWVLLYSGMEGQGSGRYSILALKPDAQIAAEDFSEFATQLSNNQERWENAWFGYLGYELKNTLERLPVDDASPSGITLPALQMARFRLLLIFDHQTKTVSVYGSDASLENVVPKPASELPVAHVKVDAIQSNMTKTAYLEKVAAIKEALYRGDVYQANLTRKFYGDIAYNDAFALFCSLSELSPAPYSAYLKYDKQAVISSSPERFVEIGEDGLVDMRPIKGSAPRGKTPEEDAEIKSKLENSEKDRAENLMIVDLCRNDISRGCEAGSVRVENLYAVESYATVHHMASTIKGQKRKDTTSLELVKGCFPPGSMTGAPKIKAMELCSQLEWCQRGVYSGAIGWFGGDGSVDLSVVIRTLIVDGNRFEFQVGGAIVLDSDPVAEWQETLVKARGIGKMLGVAEALLAKL